MKTNFNFIKSSKIFLPISIILTIVGLVLVLTKGFHYGIDFTGGNELQIVFKNQVPTVDAIRNVLEENQYNQVLVQTFGEEQEILLRSGEVDSDKIERLTQLITNQWKDATIQRVDTVGPQIGDELKRKGILALLYSLILILVYVGLRFDYNYAPAAVLCLFHDSILTMSIFSIFSKEVNVQTLAAVLAIIGYSLNDTIVTFDRIRENLESYTKKGSFVDICNQSLNNVLSRTLLTSVTTLLAVGSMWFFTSGVIKDFAFTLGIGVVIGTYSSIYVATPLAILFQKLKKS